MADMVTIRRKDDKDLTNTATASLAAFRAVWQPRGYVVVDPDTGERVSEAASVAASSAPEPEGPSDTATVDVDAAPSTRKGR